MPTRNELSPSQLIDDLINHWSRWDEHEEWYLKTLAPSLVRDPSKGDPKEREILGKLHALLNQDEWTALPDLISERRAGVLREIESERIRREAEEREKQEQAHREALRREAEEQERTRQENLRREAEAKRTNLIRELRRRLHVDFLGADSFFETSCSGVLSGVEYEQEKIDFAKNWVAAHTPPDKDGAKKSPDDEQAAAIAAVHGHIQVVARAGSGKTTTLVSRALFLQKHCGITPAEMLLLAFNRKAALEIRKGLLTALNDKADTAVTEEINQHIQEAKKQTQVDIQEIESNAIEAVAKRFDIVLPHVMTFHALARAIVFSAAHNAGDSAPDLLKDDENDHTRSRVFQQVIDDHLQVPTFKAEIRELMLAHFREDWDRIVEGCYDKSKEELLQFRRSLPHESLSGEYLKSFGEKVIADFLFEHDVAYKYERSHWWGGINYRPDFTIFKTPESGTIIEYFGLTGDTDYDEMSQDKREYWREKKDWTLLDFSPQDITIDGVDNFLSLLKRSLEAQGIPCNRLSEDEIWHRIRDRAIDRFTSTTVDFIGRCRNRSLSPAKLCDLIDSYTALSRVEGMFLHLAQRLYTAYLDRLSATGEEDFDGLMQRAADCIAGGLTIFERKSGRGDIAQLRYVCIDEFQDFSDLFYRLVVAIQEKNPHVEFFCVGDDWQAIYGFAGSDLRFFEGFEECIGPCRRLYISTNYRSSQSIVGIGNALMDGLGKPAQSHKKSVGLVLLSDLNEFEPSLLEKQRHPGDIITPAVIRLSSKALAAGLEVVLLCRRNSIPWVVNYQDQTSGGGRGLTRYVDLIRSYFPKGLKERISISTVHKYKGLEKPMVMVLDAVARSYPLIHPDWAFSRIFGDSPEKITQEERRLLYVALTRAIEQLIVITDGRSKSPFLEELEHRQQLSSINWDDFPPVRGLTSRLVVKVGNRDRRGYAPTIAIKDSLKATGYQWQSTGWAGWARSFPAEGFNIDGLKAEIWAETADGIEIRIFDHTDTSVARYFVDSGQWSCSFDNLAQTQIGDSEDAQETYRV